jgi:hypothetical protein
MMMIQSQVGIVIPSLEECRFYGEPTGGERGAGEPSPP